MPEQPGHDETAVLRARLAALTSSDPFEALAMSARLEALARAAAAEAAVAASRQGASWSEIGDAFGISKQAAHQRFAKHVKAARPR
ncbi:hypothetical protein ACFO1B_08010 [Dactylosporangium siamense]|uniref:Helix-turn-helix domain-containing protein n=1 Tax=Dactylosporangium siamense TaxID=685454 RepID=A0A919UA13_9ACTN|nr:hypothetical protein [Dactylosporangium siamense]GIG48069.1 hypothetical protein Dsi01nite_061100 [Dactylosporangium siamense]